MKPADIGQRVVIHFCVGLQVVGIFKHTKSTRAYPSIGSKSEPEYQAWQGKALVLSSEVAYIRFALKKE